MYNINSWKYFFGTTKTNTKQIKKRTNKKQWFKFKKYKKII